MAGRTTALSPEQTDRFSMIMPAIADRIRNKVKRRYLVSRTANSIPPELKWVACYLILEALMGSILFAADDGFRTQCDRAVRELDRVENGQTVVSLPDDPETTPDVQTGNGGIEIVTANHRRFTREKMDGL